MYDSILLANQAYSKGDYVECAKQLANVDEKSLPSDTSKNLYKTMKNTAYPRAASQLYQSGKALYDRYKYEDAKKDLKAAYTYSDHDYETLYLLAMCYKRLGDTKTSTPYFYDIINNSGDEDLIRKSANYGLEVLVNEAKEQAAASVNGGKTTTAEKEDSTTSKSTTEAKKTTGTTEKKNTTDEEEE